MSHSPPPPSPPPPPQDPLPMVVDPSSPVGSGDPWSQYIFAFPSPPRPFDLYLPCSPILLNSEIPLSPLWIFDDEQMGPTAQTIDSGARSSSYGEISLDREISLDSEISLMDSVISLARDIKLFLKLVAPPVGIQISFDSSSYGEISLDREISLDSVISFAREIKLFLKLVDLLLLDSEISLVDSVISFARDIKLFLKLVARLVDTEIFDSSSYGEISLDREISLDSVISFASSSYGEISLDSEISLVHRVMILARKIKLLKLVALLDSEISFDRNIVIFMWKWHCGSPGYTNLISTCQVVVFHMPPRANTGNIGDFIDLAAFKTVRRMYWIMNEEQKTTDAQMIQLKMPRLQYLGFLINRSPATRTPVTGNEEHAHNSGSRSPSLMLDRNNRPPKRMQSPLVIVRSDMHPKRMRGNNGNAGDPINAAESRGISLVWKHSRYCESPLTLDRSNRPPKRLQSPPVIVRSDKHPKRMRGNNGNVGDPINAAKSRGKSQVWNHFVKDGERAYCIHCNCKKHYAADSRRDGTSRLLRHLSDAHGLMEADDGNLCAGSLQVSDMFVAENEEPKETHALTPPKSMEGSGGKAANIVQVQHHSSGAPNNAAKPRARSQVWQHFSKDGSRAYCKHCNTNYAADSKKDGTSRLWNHLKSAHEISKASSAQNEESTPAVLLL